MDSLHLGSRAQPPPPTQPCLPDDPADVLNRQMFALVPTTIILILSLLTYGLRLIARRKTGQKLRWDDILMGIGLFIFLEPTICEYLLLANGLGRHLCNVPLDQRERFAKISFALQRANQPCLACVKISILLFYMRIFTVRPFRIAVYVNMAFVVAWAVATWIVNLTVCMPIAFFWDKTILGGSCRNQAISGSINGGLSLLGDVIILLLPLPMIWQLKINMRKKIGLLGVFLLGMFVCVASVIRIVELTKFTTNDPTYTQVYASTWTTLEQGVAVISGNLPLLAPLFDGFFRNRRGTHYYGYGGSKNTAGSSAPRSRVDRPHPHHHQTAGSGVTTVSSPRRQGGNRLDDFDRLSDTESQTQLGSVHDVELDDRSILVKTRVSVTQSRADETPPPDGLDPKDAGWMKR